MYGTLHPPSSLSGIENSHRNPFRRRDKKRTKKKRVANATRPLLATRSEVINALLKNMTEKNARSGERRRELLQEKKEWSTFLISLLPLALLRAAFSLASAFSILRSREMERENPTVSGSRNRKTNIRPREAVCFVLFWTRD